MAIARTHNGFTIANAVSEKRVLEIILMAIFM